MTLPYDKIVHFNHPTFYNGPWFPFEGEIATLYGEDPKEGEVFLNPHFNGTSALLKIENYHLIEGDYNGLRSAILNKEFCPIDIFTNVQWVQVMKLAKVLKPNGRPYLDKNKKPILSHQFVRYQARWYVNNESITVWYKDDETMKKLSELRKYKFAIKCFRSSTI